MAINVYCGLMGSGKSYEVVKSVILPAILSGRRVVTNIDGIDNQAIRSYLSEKNNIPESDLGNVISVLNENIQSDGFFPSSYTSEEEISTVVNPGDLVCIDEAWRFWGTDCKISQEHRIFFREHRHFVNKDTGLCCDLVCMVQHINDLHRLIKTVVETSFRTNKLKALGRNNNYHLSMWQGYQQAQKSVVDTWLKSYDAEIFPLYSSYSGGSGKEVAPDARQNIFNSKRLRLIVVFFFTGALISSYYLYLFFDKRLHPNKASETGTVVAVAPAVTSSRPINSSSAFPPNIEWRIVGTLVVDGYSQVVLSNGSSLRFESTTKFSGFGSSLHGIVDDQLVTRFSSSETRQKK